MTLAVVRKPNANFNQGREIPGAQGYHMISWHGNTFYITGPLWGESIGHIVPQELSNLFFALLAHCERNPQVTGGFPSQRASNVKLWCLFVVSMNKMLNKQLICWWFEMPLMWVNAMVSGISQHNDSPERSAWDGLLDIVNIQHMVIILENNIISDKKAAPLSPA